MVTWADELLQAVQLRNGKPEWDIYIEAWYRIVRRVVLNDSTPHSEELSDLLTTLRAKPRWGYRKPKEKALKERFQASLRDHPDRTEPRNLAASWPAFPKTT